MKLPISSWRIVYEPDDFYQFLNLELFRARRHKYPLSLILIKIELKDISLERKKGIFSEFLRVIRKNTRQEDIIGVLEEDKIGVILPYTKSRSAFSFSERIKKSFYQYPLYKEEKQNLYINIGFATYPINALQKEDLIQQAQHSLQISYQKGKNEIYSSLNTAKAEIKVAFSPPAFVSFYYTYILTGMKEIAEDFGGIEIISRAPKNESDVDEHLKIIDEFIEDKPDALAICSMVGVAMGTKIKKANEKGIPVFFFNTPFDLIPSTPGTVVSCIGYNQKEAGRKVGRYLVRILRKKGKIGIIEGLGWESTSKERKSGFLEEIKKFPEMKILDSRPADWDPEKAEQITELYLKTYPQIDAIFALDDDMGLAVVKVLKEKNKIGDLFVVSIDGSQDAFRSIKQGELTATLNTNPQEMGRILMRNIIKYVIKKENIHSQVLLPIMIVDEENVDYFLL